MPSLFYAGQLDYVAKLNALADSVAALGGSSNVALPVVYNASYTFDCTGRKVFDITLLGNIIMGFANAYDGQQIIVRPKQDGTGNRILTFAANTIRYGEDTPSFTLSTAANKTDYIALCYSAAAARYDLVGFNRGF